MSASYRLAIFASGSGSNAEAICRYFNQHSSIQVGVILSNKVDAGVFQHAIKFSVPWAAFNKEDFSGDAILKLLAKHEVTHIVLAGFLWLVPQHLIRAYPSRIINIHPSLLPKFGGKGMYGIRVHEAVKQSGETTTGLTIHTVNEKYDEGTYLFQASCDVHPQDTPADIATRVLALEHQQYAPVIERWVLAQ